MTSNDILISEQAIHALRTASLDERQEAVIFALLELTKPRKKSPGAKRGHAGSRRATPERIDTPWTDSHAKRLLKRLRRHRDDLFTFLDQPNVPFENNAATTPSKPSSKP